MKGTKAYLITQAMISIFFLIYCVYLYFIEEMAIYGLAFWLLITCFLVTLVRSKKGAEVKEASKKRAVGFFFSNAGIMMVEIALGLCPIMTNIATTMLSAVIAVIGGLLIGLGCFLDRE